jgi:hypothetical protein
MDATLDAGLRLLDRQLVDKDGLLALRSAHGVR